MPPNGPDEWRARIGHWENRKLRWYQAHCGSRPRVPLHLHLERVISEAPLLCVLLLLSLAGKVGNGVCEVGLGTFSSLGKSVVRCCACGRRGKVRPTPLLSLFLALSLLLVLAGDVETNPGPISDELLAQVDDSELSEKDTRDVCREVIGLAGRWSGMCLALGLLPSDQSTIKATHPGNPYDCLQAVVVKWLQKGYDYQRYGPPTWRMLVDAVGDPLGGNNNALAEAIADKHPVIKKVTSAETYYDQHQVQLSKPSGKSPRLLEEASAETAEPEEVMISDDEEWDPPTEFAAVFTKIAKQLNSSADVEDLKCFLEVFGHPHTGQRHISIKLYAHCETPREIIKALVPRYINFMHTPILRGIVNTFGDEQSKTLLKQYEDNFPRKKPLKRMRDPLTIEESENCPGNKRMKVTCDGDSNVDTTTVADVERVRHTISRNTGIDENIIVYANQTPGSVIFTFLIPETLVSTLIDLSEDSQRDLADHGILRIEVSGLVIDLQSLQAETNADISTYTTSGMKRVPLTLDSPEGIHYSSEFQQLLSEVGASLAESVEASKLRDFLQSFTHILYPETQYIDPSLLKDTESIPQMLTALQPQILNYLNWSVLWKAMDSFHIKVMPAFQFYTNSFPPHTKLSTLPDPLSEEEISGFKRFQKLRVTRGGGSRIEWTLGDVQAVREAVEKATGIDENFIIYAYWEGGFTTHQFTFLIPKSVSGIFGELCEEDRTILAGRGVQKLEVAYDTVADNIQEHYKELPGAVIPVRADTRLRTKNFGLEHFIPEDVAEQMSEEDFGHLNDLITRTPAGKLQEVCSNDFLKVFAKKMGSWKDLAPYLGINRWDLEDLAEMYPGDEEEQKYVALLNWKSIDVNSATYERLLECLLTHGHIDDAEKLLLLQFQGPEVQKAQEILQQRFLKDLFSKRKLWVGAPKLPRFNRRLGIVQNVPLLSELDYTSCHEMMDQFPSEIQELSMKLIMNKIGQRESRVFIFKGPPRCGKTELISRLCRYWAKRYVLRQFSLVLYLNIWDFNQGCSLQDLIYRQFKGSIVSSEKICRWIEEEKGNNILFILDGFCRKYLYRSPLRNGDLFTDILCGRSSFSKSTVVIATTCSHFVKPLCENFIQFDILGLSDEQIGKQVIQHFDSEKASNFLTYLAENQEINGLVSSPAYLIVTMYVFTHISYGNLPVTWTQLYTSLIVLVNEWHKEELRKGIDTNSLQSQFKNALLEGGRKVLNSGDLSMITTISESLTCDAKDCDHELPDHNSAVPYLEYFLFGLETALNLDFKKLTLSDKDEFAYFWCFLAGLIAINDSKNLLKQYYKRNVLKLTKCLTQVDYVTAEQQADLSTLTAEVGWTVVTTHDIHSVLQCLPYMEDPHTVVLDNCFLGRQAARELSRFLAADSWSNIHTYRVIRHYSGIRHLRLTGIPDEAVRIIAVALKTNQTLQTLKVTGLTSTGTIALTRALECNKSLMELNLERNEIRESGASALADTLRVNQSLKTLNLRNNDLTSTGAITLARALQDNKSLEKLNFEGNKVGKSGASALADTLRVNQSLKTLNLRDNDLTDTGAITLARALQDNRSLEDLNLEGNKVGKSGASALADTLRVNQSLKTLNLRMNDLTDTGAITLARALQDNRSLEDLNLEGNKVGKSGASALADTLRVNQSLKTLNLSHNNLTSIGAITLARALQDNKSLEELNLDWAYYQWTGIGDEEASALADPRVIKNFKILDLRTNDLTDTGAITLARALLHNKLLEKLNLEGNKVGKSGASALADSLRVNQSLKTLNLGTNDLTSTGAITLSRALQDNRSLEDLNLEGNEIGNSGATALADALRVNQSLTTLNVRWNGIKDSGAIALANGLRVNWSLTTLNLEWNRTRDSGATALADALRVNQSLTTLNLEGNEIGESGATALADALRVNQSLTTLNLGWNRTGESGSTALSDALKVNWSLTTLDLRWNGIGDSGATALADALRVNWSLTTLNLWGNTIGDSGATALADALSVNQSLTTLDLGGNGIKDSGATALADALRVNQSLTTLKLGRLWRISERTRNLLKNNARITMT